MSESVGENEAFLDAVAGEIGTILDSLKFFLQSIQTSTNEWRGEIEDILAENSTAAPSHQGQRSVSNELNDAVITFDSAADRLCKRLHEQVDHTPSTNTINRAPYQANLEALIIKESVGIELAAASTHNDHQTS